jgi:hypothetical protein
MLMKYDKILMLISFLITIICFIIINECATRRGDWFGGPGIIIVFAPLIIFAQCFLSLTYFAWKKKKWLFFLNISLTIIPLFLMIIYI